jgi:hypothetical protein
MSSAVKAKPVVSGVGEADADGSEAGGKACVGDGDVVLAEGDADGLGLTTLDPQAASSSAMATTNQARLRGRGRWNKRRLHG